MTAVAARVATLRMGVRPFERPDRLIRAMAAMAPYGMGLVGAIAGASARYPGAPAVVTPTETLTYRDLWHRSGQLGTALQDHGITTGERIGLLARNDSFFVIAMLAGARVGADVVLMNTAMAGPQLADVVEAESVRLLLHEDALEKQASSCAVETWSATQALELASQVAHPALQPQHPGELIVLTSGTTGRPRGARRPTSGKRASSGAQTFAAALPWSVRKTAAIPAPFFHAWGLAGLIIALSLSCTVVTRPVFDAEELLSDLDEHNPHLLVAVPIMLQRLVELPAASWIRHNPTRISGVLSSGSGVPAPVVRAIQDRLGPVLYNVYGSTEVAASTIARPADLLRDPSTAGRPAPGVRVLILDESGNKVSRGDVGQIHVGSSMTFGGYTSGENRASVEGLVATGDLGHWDEYGCLCIDGRADDMIVSGGENVYPVEVEELLMSHPEVVEAVVAGRPDPDFGQALVAWVALRTGSAVDAEALRGHVRASLASFKVPRRIEIVESLPRNATGKILRRELT